MSIAAVVTRGYGIFRSVTDVPTRGYTIGGVAPPSGQSKIRKNIGFIVNLGKLMGR